MIDEAMSTHEDFLLFNEPLYVHPLMVISKYLYSSYLKYTNVRDPTTEDVQNSMTAL